MSPLPLVVPLPLPKGPLRPRALIKRTKEKKGIFGISKKKTIILIFRGHFCPFFVSSVVREMPVLFRDWTT